MRCRPRIPPARCSASEVERLRTAPTIQRITPRASIPPNGPPGRIRHPRTAPLLASIISGATCKGIFLAAVPTCRRAIKEENEDPSLQQRVRVKDGCANAVCSVVGRWEGGDTWSDSMDVGAVSPCIFCRGHRLSCTRLVGHAETVLAVPNEPRKRHFALRAKSQDRGIP